MANPRSAFVVGDDLGITPEVQAKLDTAASLCQQAYTEIEAAFGAAQEHSDAARRCADALDELHGVLLHLEWTPPQEYRNG